MFGNGEGDGGVANFNRRCHDGQGQEESCQQDCSWEHDRPVLEHDDLIPVSVTLILCVVMNMNTLSTLLKSEPRSLKLFVTGKGGRC